MSSIQFILTSLVIILIKLAYYYRKKKKTAHHIMTLSFILYLATAYTTVILPLPSSKVIAYLDHVHASTYSLDWSYAFDVFINYNPIFTQGNIISGLTSSSFTQILFNILLTLPFGLYLNLHFKQKFGLTFAYTIGLTLFFELTQLSALYGLYPRPYRLFDVDDILLNTIGSIIGFAMGQFYKHIKKQPNF